MRSLDDMRGVMCPKTSSVSFTHLMQKERERDFIRNQCPKRGVWTLERGPVTTTQHRVAINLSPCSAAHVLRARQPRSKIGVQWA